MKKATGKMKKIILKIVRIQDLAGNAKGIYLNDRAHDRAEKLTPILEEIFNICVEIRGDYEIVEDEK
jgi:hypothetical protein